MPWIWKAAKRVARGGYKRYEQGSRGIRWTNDWMRRSITRPVRYADIAYRNRGGKYYYPKVGFGAKGGYTPYQGSQAQKDALYWKRKYDRIMRSVFNERPQTRSRYYSNTRTGRGPRGR